jgi:hypothetical protein
MTDASRHLSQPSQTVDVDELAAAFDRRNYKSRRDDRSQGDHAAFNGSTKFVNWMLSVTTVLMISAIVGGVVLYGQVQSINTKVDLLIAGHIK